MSTLESRFHLKKPLLIYAMANCFIAAPLANIIASMISFHVYRWYAPSTFLTFVERISWGDWSWLLLTLAAGFCLLIQRKWTWLVAIAALIVASFFNFRFEMKFGGHLAHGGGFFPFLFMLSDLAVVIILYHFRFPYVDRREAWWGMKPRYRCRLDASADAGQGAIPGVITNISITGAFLEVPAGKIKQGSFVTLQLSPLPPLKTEVVRCTDQGCGLQFQATPEQIKEIKRLIAGLKEGPIGDPVLSLKA